MQKLTIIFSHASLYREPIYKLIDSTFNCEWHFSDEDANVKRFDTKPFRATIHKFHKLKRGTWISGILPLLRKKDNTTFLIAAAFIDYSYWMFVLLAKIFYPRKNVYAWGHGWYGKETYLKKLTKKIFIKCLTGFFVYGEYAKKLMVANGVPKDKIFVLHNSLNYDVQLKLRNTINKTDIYKNHFNNNNYNIIYLGRLMPVKKLDQLISATATLRDKKVSVNLIFVGDGPMRSSLEKQVADLGLTDSVWFYGACYDEQTNAELVYNADLCVAPGNIGLTAMHSMVFGTPVLSHDDFKLQMPEFEAIVPGKTGNFFKRDSVESIADTIEKWFNNPLYDRDLIRQSCYSEIDNYWNPHFQIKVIKDNLKFANE